MKLDLSLVKSNKTQECMPGMLSEAFPSSIPEEQFDSINNPNRIFTANNMLTQNTPYVTLFTLSVLITKSTGMK